MAGAFLFSQTVPPAVAESWKSRPRTDMKMARLTRDASFAEAPLSAATPLITKGLPVAAGGSLAARPAPAPLGALPLQGMRIDEWRWAGPDAPLVLQVRNVHGHVGAQKNINSFIRELAESGRADWVAMEGAAGLVDLAPYRKPAAAVRRELTSYFLNAGLLSGAESAVIAAERAVPLIGLEEPAAYLRNVDAVKKSLPRQAALRARLTVWRAELEGAKRRVYAPALLELDASDRAYRAGRKTLGEHLETAAAQSPAARPASVELFLSAYRLERRIDFARAEKERAGFIEKISAEFSDAELRSLLDDTLRLRLGGLSQSDYYGRLRRLAASRGVALSAYPQLDAYMKYVAAAESIRPSFAGELAAYRKAALAKLARAAAEKDVARAAERLDFLEDLAALAVTSDAWASRPGEFKDLITLPVQLAPFAKGLPAVAEADLKPFWSFYAEAGRRDDLMSGRLRDELAKRGSKTVVVVTGGFHSAGMSRALREAGFSYAQISPRLDRVEPKEASRYLDAFLRPPDALEKLFSGERLTLEYVSSLKPLHPDYAFREEVLKGTYAGLASAVDFFFNADRERPTEDVAEALSVRSEIGRVVRSRDFIVLDVDAPASGRPVSYVVMTKAAADRARASEEFKDAVSGLRLWQDADGEELSIGLWTGAARGEQIARSLAALTRRNAASLAAGSSRPAGLLLSDFVFILRTALEFLRLTIYLVPAFFAFLRFIWIQAGERSRPEGVHVPEAFTDPTKTVDELLPEVFPIAASEWKAAKAGNGLFEKITAMRGSYDPKHSQGPYAALADTDKRGRHYRFLDFGQFGAKAFGDNRPDMIKKLLSEFHNVVDKWSLSDTQTRLSLKFKETLGKFAPFGVPVVFVVNTGAEAVENAIKALIYLKALPSNVVPTDRNAFLIRYKKSFHGRTLGALGATDSPKARKHFSTYNWPTVNFPGADYVDGELLDNEDLRARERESLIGSWKLIVTGWDESAQPAESLFDEDLSAVQSFLDRLYGAEVAGLAGTERGEKKHRLALEFAQEYRRRIAARSPDFFKNAQKALGLIVEPVQGEGGIRYGSSRYFQQLRMLCLLYNVPFVFDEVQTGFGLTGTFWSHERFDLPAPPDIVTGAKKFQMGVVFLNRKFAEFFNGERSFNTTWEGDATGMMRSMMYLDLMDLEKITELGRYALGRLTALQKMFPTVIEGARGEGFMLGIGFKPVGDKTAEQIRDAVQDAAMRRGLMLNMSGMDTLRFYPRYDAEQRHVDEAMGILAEAVQAVYAREAVAEKARAQAPPPAAADLRPLSQPQAGADAADRAPEDDAVPPPAKHTRLENFIQAVKNLPALLRFLSFKADFPSFVTGIGLATKNFKEFRLLLVLIWHGVEFYFQKPFLIKQLIKDYGRVKDIKQTYWERTSPPLTPLLTSNRNGALPSASFEVGDLYVDGFTQTLDHTIGGTGAAARAVQRLIEAGKLPREKVAPRDEVALVDAFNFLMEGPWLREAVAETGGPAALKLSSQAAALYEAVSSGKSGGVEDERRLNRALIEAVFPEAIREVVVVIGTGFTGASTAYHMGLEFEKNPELRKKYKVVLVGRDSGASVRNGGAVLSKLDVTTMGTADYDLLLNDVMESYGLEEEEDAIVLIHLLRNIFISNIRRIEGILKREKAVADREGIQTNFKLGGWFEEGDGPMPKLRRQVELARSRGFEDWNVYDREQIRAKTDFKYDAAYYFSINGQIHPAEYLRLLLTAALEKGRANPAGRDEAVQFYRGSVKELSKDSRNGYSVEVDFGDGRTTTLRADKVVLAAEAFTRKVAPDMPAFQSYHTIRSQPHIFETDRDINYGDMVVTTGDTYMVQVGKREALVGSDDTLVSDPANFYLSPIILYLCAMEFHRLFPDVNFRLKSLWAGTVAESDDHLLSVGKVDDNLYASFGYKGDGMLATSAGYQIAREILGLKGPRPFIAEIFSPRRHKELGTAKEKISKIVAVVKTKRSKLEEQKRKIQAQKAFSLKDYIDSFDESRGWDAFLEGLPDELEAKFREYEQKDGEEVRLYVNELSDRFGLEEDHKNFLIFSLYGSPLDEDETAGPAEKSLFERLFSRNDGDALPADLAGVPSLELHVGGEWRAASEGKAVPVVDPTTQDVLYVARNASEKEQSLAVGAAREAFPGWSALTRKERGEYLLKLAEAIRANPDELAAKISREMGKTFVEAQGEVGVAIVVIEKLVKMFAEEGRHDVEKPAAQGELDYFRGTYGMDMAKSAAYEKEEPLGVALIISPFNFPLALPLENMVAALIAGNTIVWKPSEYTPGTAEAAMRLMADVFPKGVVNLTYGDGEVGASLVRNEGVDVVSFTGSVETGRKIKLENARVDNRYPLIMEGGGDNPQVVLPDADMGVAVAHLVMGAFTLAGEMCSHTQRAILVKNKDGVPPLDEADFEDKLLTAVKALKIIPGLDPASQMGAIVSKKQLDKLEQQVTEILTLPGATLLHGGRRLGYDAAGNPVADEAQYQKGNFYAPTVIRVDAGSDAQLRVNEREIFGPVLFVTTVDTVEEGIEMANDTPYGLTASVYTKDIRWLEQNLERLQAGGRFGNGPTNFDVDTMATIMFGGAKWSALGSNGHVLGRNALAPWVKHSANVIVVAPEETPPAAAAPAATEAAPQPPSVKETVVSAVRGLSLVQTLKEWWSDFIAWLRYRKSLLRAEQLRIFVNGVWRDGVGERRVPVVNPTTQEILYKAANGTLNEIDESVDAAREAFPGWSALTRKERGEYLLKWAEAIRGRQNELAEKISREMGKTFVEAQGEAGVAIVVIEKLVKMFAEEGRHDVEKPTAQGEVDYFRGTYGMDMAKSIAYEKEEPVGVALIISPFNFPLALPIENMVAALLAGNTIVWKPSEYTPGTAEAAVKLAEGIFPPGVLNLTYGDGETGAALVRHEGIDVVSFTGSVETGRKIKHMNAEVDNRYPLIMEGGGDNPQVVLPDADMALALNHLVMGTFTLAGEMCSHTQRAILVKNKDGVPPADYGDFLEKLTAAARALKIIPGLDPASQMGAIVSKKQLAKLEKQVDDVLALDGATLLTGGRRLGYDADGNEIKSEDHYQKGNFYAPTVILVEKGSEAERRSRTEEIFGPVLFVTLADTVDEGIELANATPYGLTASVYTRDIAWLEKNLERLQAGGRFGNGPTNFDVDTMGTIMFGGAKWSALGSNGHVLGRNALAPWVKHSANVIVVAPDQDVAAVPPAVPSVSAKAEPAAAVREAETPSASAQAPPRTTATSLLRRLSAAGLTLLMFAAYVPAFIRQLYDIASSRSVSRVNPVGEGDIAAKLPLSAAWIQTWRERHNFGEPYYPYKAGFLKGNGPYWVSPDKDARGENYVWLDFAASIAAEPFGYRFGPVVRALLTGRFLTAALNKLSHTTAMPEYAAEFHRTLDLVAPEGMGKRLFANGGAEVVEAALRAANYHRPGRFVPNEGGLERLREALARLGDSTDASDAALRGALARGVAAYEKLSGLRNPAAVREAAVQLKDSLFEAATLAERLSLERSREADYAFIRAAAEDARASSFRSFVIHFKGSYHGRSAAAAEITESGGQSKGFETRGWPAVDFPEMDPGLAGTIGEDDVRRAIEGGEDLRALWRDVDSGALRLAGDAAEVELLKRELQALITIDRLIAADPDAARAVIAEPIQSEGGDRHASGRFFRSLRRLTKKYGVALIADEVQTGFGITGNLWAHQGLGLVGELAPDMMTTAKSLQVPVLFYSDAYFVPERALQGNTWQGTGTDMVRAIEFIRQLVKPGALEHVRRVGRHFYDGLKRLEEEFPGVVVRVRGRDTGLFLSFDLATVDVKKKFIDRSFRNGLLMLGAGTRTIRVRGFRNLTTAHVDEGLALIRKSLEEATGAAALPASSAADESAVAPAGRSATAERLLSVWSRVNRLPGGGRIFGFFIGWLVPYSGTIRPDVRSLTPGHAVVSFSDRRGVRNHLGSVHAIALANLGELATGLAVTSSLPVGARGIPVSLSVDYVKKARGRLTAESRVTLPPPARDVNVEAEAVIRDETGAVVSRVRAIWRLGFDLPTDFAEPFTEDDLGAAPNLFIGGEWRTGEDVVRRVISPATGEPIDRTRDASVEQVQAAVAEAVRAFDESRKPEFNVPESVDARAESLRNAARLLEERAGEIAALISEETGKSSAGSLAEVKGAAGVFNFFGTEKAAEVKAAMYPALDGTSKSASEVYRPAGVGAVIVPFNVPLGIAAWNIAGGFLFGNALVYKPSEQTPKTAAALVKILEEAGFPRGSVNLVMGGPAAGTVLVADERVSRVSFTGSTLVGRIIEGIGRKIAGRKDRLELGGNNVEIVMPSMADAETARRIVAAAFSYSGQYCNHTQRVILVGAIPDAFVGALRRAADEFVKANGLEPLVSERQMNKFLEQVARLRRGGEATGGVRVGRPGFFVTPAVVVDKTPDQRLGASEEIFGPALVISRAATYEDAKRQALDLEGYGLVWTIHTDDETLMRDAIQHFPAGRVRVNHGPVSASAYPGVEFNGFPGSNSALNSAGGALGRGDFDFWAVRTSALIERRAPGTVLGVALAAALGAKALLFPTAAYAAGPNPTAEAVSDPAIFSNPAVLVAVVLGAVLAVVAARWLARGGLKSVLDRLFSSAPASAAPALEPRTSLEDIGVPADAIARASALMAGRVMSSADRAAVLAFIRSALPPMAGNLLPGGASDPEADAGAAESLAAIYAASLKLSIDPASLTAEERRLLPYATEAELEATSRRIVGEDDAAALRRLLRGRLRAALSDGSGDLARRGKIAFSEAGGLAALLGYLHEKDVLLGDVSDAEEDDARKRARAPKKAAEAALFSSLLFGALESPAPTFAEARAGFEAAYAAGADAARTGAPAEVRREQALTQAGEQAASEAEGLPSTTFDVYHVSDLLAGRERADRLASRLLARAREFAEAAEDGRRLRPDTFVVEGVSAADAEALRSRLAGRLAAAAGEGADRGAIDLYLRSTTILSTPKSLISPDWLYDALQSRFGGSRFTMNVYTTNASAWETESRRKDLAWKLFLIVSETEVVDVLRTLEEGLKAIRLLGTQA